VLQFLHSWNTYQLSPNACNSGQFEVIWRNWASNTSQEKQVQAIITSAPAPSSANIQNAGPAFKICGRTNLPCQTTMKCGYLAIIFVTISQRFFPPQKDVIRNCDKSQLDKLIETETPPYTCFESNTKTFTAVQSMLPKQRYYALIRHVTICVRCSIAAASSNTLGPCKRSWFFQK
jgi:hypothetical protein